VNGVCLTCLPSDDTQLHFDVSSETLRLTTLGTLKIGDIVNIERAMNANTRYGGHYVSGHVDTTAYVHSVLPLGEYIELALSGFSAAEMLYLIPKGSISVDGVSLTINTVTKGVVSLMIIPHTLSQTTLGLLKPGQFVNIEFDYLTRIVAHQIQVFRTMYDEVTP
jgi:riboflavin synthase